MPRIRRKMMCGPQAATRPLFMLCAPEPIEVIAEIPEGAPLSVSLAARVARGHWRRMGRSASAPNGGPILSDGASAPIIWRIIIAIIIRRPAIITASKTDKATAFGCIATGFTTARPTPRAGLCMASFHEGGMRTHGFAELAAFPISAFCTARRIRKKWSRRRQHLAIAPSGWPTATRWPVWCAAMWRRARRVCVICPAHGWLRNAALR